MLAKDIAAELAWAFNEDLFKVFVALKADLIDFMDQCSKTNIVFKNVMQRYVVKQEKLLLLRYLMP